jgi:uncharacterized phage-associated protein
MSIDVNGIAETIIALTRDRRSEITNLKLQKLLYYTQAWNLAFTGNPLFLESIEAWVHGPVVPSIFRRFREYRWMPINSAVEPYDDGGVRRHIESVLNAYDKFDATQLERLTHSEDPWKIARGNLAPDMSSRNVISNIVMRDYYRARLACANAKR